MIWEPFLNIRVLKWATRVMVLLCGMNVISAASAADMVRVEGQAFNMGSQSHYREEGPIRTVTVSAFLIGETEVTNAEFGAFVDATGYITTAERGLKPEDRPGWPPELLEPGSMVFAQPSAAVDLDNPNKWWRWVPGANWRVPEGPGSSIIGRDDHPVVQVSPEDAEAYASWVGGRLPTEAEWELAARGGLGDGASWEEPYDPISGWKANTWQGEFPATDLIADGHHGTAPVASFAANGYGIHDMLGNVWEHVVDWWVPTHPNVSETDPRGPSETLAAQFSHPEIGAQRVVKGGSWLCAPAFCMRYRPTARQPFERGLGSNHTGFRVAKGT